MELIYASLLLHDAGKEINEANLKKVMDAVGAKTDAAMIKALVSNMKEVNIEEAIKNASVMHAAPTATPTAGKAAEEKKEVAAEKSDEQKQEEAAAGLSSLFG